MAKIRQHLPDLGNPDRLAIQEDILDMSLPLKSVVFQFKVGFFIDFSH